MKLSNAFFSFLSISLLLFITACADKEMGNKYQTLRIETNKLLSQVDIIIKDQKVQYDSLNKVQTEFISRQLTIEDIKRLHNEILNTIDIQESMNKLKIYLESIRFNCTIIEKASTRFGYLFKRKGKIKKMYTKTIYDTNREIRDLTGGLAPKDYIKKYLP
jgi:hypothetical protein